MKIFNKNLIIAVLVVSLVAAFDLVGPITVSAATAPSLGAAATYSVLAQTAITDAGAASSITGDVGMNASGASITGLTAAQVSPGLIYSNPLVAPATALLPSAVQADASTAFFSTIPALPIEGTPIAVSELNGITRGPGVYDLPGGAVTLSGGVLTLDGPGTYIFRITTSLTSSGSVNLINGARACDVFWNVGSLASISAGGPGTSFAGTILAGTGVHFTPGVTLDGRALAIGGDVTMSSTTISGPTCAVAPATINVIKHVTNDNGGAKNASDFILTIGGVTAVGGNTVTGTEAPGVSKTLSTVGAYTVTETGLTGYSQSSSADCSGTIAAGETKTCTITNNDIAPQLTVTKIVVGGTKVVANFPLFIDGGSVTSGLANTVLAGLHTVSETSDSGYTSVIAGHCATNGTITLAPGDVKICTITNNYIVPSTPGITSGYYTYVPPVPPLIDVVKVPNPLSLPIGSNPVVYTYTLRNVGTVPVDQITMVDDTCSPVALVSGDTNNNTRLEVNEIWTYSCSATLSETHTNTVVATGWANGVSTTDIASATVVVGAPVVPPLIHVTKIPNPLALSAGGGTVTYTEKITNPGTVALSNVRLTDDKCSPMKYISGDINNDSKLDTAETWTYTCQTKLAKTTTNTATAIGEANGITVRDFAIATVVVAAAVPKLPNTGFANVEKNIPWNIITLVGIFAVAIFLYFARRKQTN